MNSRDKFLELIRPSLLSVSITFIVLTLIAVLHANILTPTLPITVISSEARAWTGTEVVILEYHREFTVTDDFIGTVLRTVQCNNGRNYDLPDTTRSFKEGTHTTRRTVLLPYSIPLEAECTLSTSVAWQPPLAFIKYIQNVEHVNFTVNPFPSLDREWVPTGEEGK